VFMKLVVDQKDDRVIGVRLLGECSAEIVQLAAVAMNVGATKADFDRTVALHPSAAEELVTMRSKHPTSDVIPEVSAEATPAI